MVSMAILGVMANALSGGGSIAVERGLGWKPEIGFEDGLRETVEWYAANRAWWEPLRERLQVEETAWR